MGVRTSDETMKIASAPSIQDSSDASWTHTRTPEAAVPAALRRHPMSSNTRVDPSAPRRAAAWRASLISMPQWLHASRSRTISGGPSACAAHPAASSITTPSTVRVRVISLLDDQPALHLEVQRRAEFGAVEAVGAGPIGDELHRRRLARIEAHHHVLRRDREAVRRVFRLLGVGEVDDDLVADLRRHDVGREVAADDVHPHFHDARALDDARLFFTRN